MSLRRELTTTALLGTLQQPFAPQPAGTPLDAPLARLRSREPAQQFLDAAALITLYEAAGAVPGSAPPPPPPAGEDSRPRVSPAAAGHLTSLLADRRAVLSEWLILAAEAGQRPPEELVPALLDVAANDRALRSLVASACGPLAVWLAQFRPEWNWITAPAVDDSRWETGTPDERAALLLHLRSADPERSRTLLQASWPTESADVKRRFLEVFEAGQSLADEPFLEDLLDDRSVVVRRAAAEHLASIAGSRLIERMKARLAGRVRALRTGLLRKMTIDVEPFESIDPAMQRDGIEKKAPAGGGMGERAWWTLQAIAAIPPVHWCQLFELNPSDLMQAAKNGQWHALLLEGWRMAAVRHTAVDWLEALAEGEIEPGQDAERIFRALPQEGRERAMLRLLDEDSKKWLAFVPSACPHEWSIALTERFVRAVEQGLSKEPTDPSHYQARLYLRPASRYASPLANWPEHLDAFAEFTNIVAFRRQMRRAFQSPRS